MISPPVLAGLVLDELIVATSKSAIWKASFEDKPAIVKQLRSEEGFWIEKFHNEVAVYSYFRDQNSINFAPRMYWPSLSNAPANFFIIDLIDAEPLARERYPLIVDENGLLEAINTAFVIETLSMPGAKVAMNYEERILRYQKTGFMDYESAEMLTKLFVSCSNVEWRFQHGDLLPANILRSFSRVVFLDWEFAGMYLPGYDLALMTVVCSRCKRSKEIISSCLQQNPSLNAPYFLNLAMVLTREMRILTEANQVAELEHVSSLWLDYKAELRKS